MLYWLSNHKKKKLNNKVKAMLAGDRQTIRKALNKIVAINEMQVINADEVVEIVRAISPSGFEYRVNLFGAEEIYDAITIQNYRKLVNGMGHLEEEDEFLVALCLMDKCEEFGDYKALVQVFSIFEYVVRHKKDNGEIITFAREYNIRMRNYLTQLNLL